MIRREKMTFKYALSWLATGALVVGLSSQDWLLNRLSHLAGFSLPSNFVYFLFSMFVIFLSLLLTVYANEQSKRSEILAQSLAILENRQKKIEEEIKQKSSR